MCLRLHPSPGSSIRMELRVGATCYIIETSMAEKFEQWPNESIAGASTLNAALLGFQFSECWPQDVNNDEIAKIWRASRPNLVFSRVIHNVVREPSGATIEGENKRNPRKISEKLCRNIVFLRAGLAKISFEFVNWSISCLSRERQRISRSWAYTSCWSANQSGHARTPMVSAVCCLGTFALFVVKLLSYLFQRKGFETVSLCGGIQIQ